MNAAVLHGSGRYPRYESFAEPVPDEGQAVLEVAAAALKPIDRWMAEGSHYASFRKFPVVVGADGVGTLQDGTRVAFFGPVHPYGGMAERALVRRGLWFELPDTVDSVVAAAITNPGMAAWKALIWRGGLKPGQTVLILGATGASGRIAVQLAARRGAGRIVATGRNPQVLAELRDLGADEVIRLDQPQPDLADAFRIEHKRAGVDLIVDYVWGAPAQALFTALTEPDLHPGRDSERVLHVQVGPTAGDTVHLDAGALRSTPLEIVGSGSGAQPTFDDAVNAYDDLMRAAASREIRVAVETLPLSEVEQAWALSRSDRRIVFLP
jgi:NADPH:quinone reductase-like Zn-dependent oxidoreductase